ncbi:MAG: Ig-like domain-containing protein [Gemmatimonadota bacterium]|nr:Ig-like domain-containing protein [Gemmatimonadota bacterium]
MRGRPSGASALALLALASGCAHIEAPSGGPADRTPPAVVVIRPGQDTIVPGWNGPVVFAFDERISERDIESAVLVSPRTSPVVVSHGRDQLRVSLRGGWERDRIYQVTLRPIVSDLFGNRLANVETLVFSTGPAIPNTAVTGTALDRLTGRRMENIRVEAIRLTDSLVYAVPTDTAGAFALRKIPTGEYKLRAFQDNNGNRSLEPYEPRDTAFVEVTESTTPVFAFRVVEPDSTPPVAGRPSIVAGRIRVTFDDYLDEAAIPDTSSVVVADSSGATVRIGLVTFEELTRVAPGTRTVPVPLPSRTLIIAPAEGVELAPETGYTIEIRGVRNVNGLEADIRTEVTTPPAPAVQASPASSDSPVVSP